MISLLLCSFFLLLLIQHASVYADYFAISQADMDYCKRTIGGDDGYNALVSYFNSSGITVNHGGYGGGDPNTMKPTTINTWDTGIYSSGFFTCVALDDTYPQYASNDICPPGTPDSICAAFYELHPQYNVCPTRTPDGVCVPPVGLSPVSYISCSCAGVCVRASNTFYDYQNYNPPNGYYAKNTWSTCICHPDYYGERCQYKKGPDDIKRLAAGLIDIRDFPYLPWYPTVGEQYVWLTYKHATMNYDSTYTPHTESATTFDTVMPTLSGQTMWLFGQTWNSKGLDYAQTTWSWPGSAHSCPYGMILVASYGTGLPNNNNLWSGFNTANDAYLHYYGITRDREHFVCMCDSTQGSHGCSGQGNCRAIVNGQDVNFNLVYNTATGFVTMSISDTSLFPPSIGKFPTAFWAQNSPDIMLPDHWSVCECYPDFDGMYCEIDNRNQAVCDNKGIYIDTITDPNANKWDEPGDCICVNGARHFYIGGTPPAPDNVIGPLHQSNVLTGYNRTNFFYRLSTDRIHPVRRQHVCLDDKDITICNNRGVYNSIYKSGIDVSTTKQTDIQVGCECFLFQDAARTILYDRTKVTSAYLASLNNPANRTLRENIAGGTYCETSCRISKCNNHGTCKYQLRSQYFQQYSGLSSPTFYFNWDMYRATGKQKITLNPASSLMFWPTEDTTPKPDFVSDLVISDVCDCDDGWSGDQCQHNVASNSTCNEFALSATTDLITCKGACNPAISFYNDTLARCIGLCPNMTAFDPYDPYTSDTSGIGQVCGGPTRGTCNGFDGRSLTCTCKPGFINPEAGCNLSVCPRVRNQMCNGRGTCKPQTLVTGVGIGRSVYRCECQDGWKGEACEIQDRTGGDKCNSNTQQSYNRENLDWPIL